MENVDTIFKKAFDEGRDFLYEFEVYDLLEKSGLEVLPYRYIPANEPVNDSELKRIFKDRVVVKVVSSGITHKTEAGGVRIGLTVDEVGSTIDEMKRTIPGTYAEWIIKHKDEAPLRYGKLVKNRHMLEKEISGDIRGFLVVEQLEYESRLGNELLLGIRDDSAFGPVLLFGFGGVKVDFYSAAFREGSSFIIGSPLLSNVRDFERMYKELPVYSLLSGRVRGEKKVVEDDVLRKAVSVFLGLAKKYTSSLKNAEWNIIEAEVNPFVAAGGKIFPLDGLVKFEKTEYEGITRPIEKIDRLLNPKTVGIIGVSGKRPTPAGTILKNLQKSGFKNENIFVIHPSEEAINGCTCYKSPDELRLKLGNKKIDMFVVGIPALAPPGRGAADIIEYLVNHDMAESLTIISSGFDETEKGREKTEHIRKTLRNAHRKKGGGVVCNGPNTLGNISSSIDTRFTQPYKNAADGTGKNNTAFICQSGAFMLTRMGNLAGSVYPVVAISVGNQIDLTISDYVKHLKDKERIDVIAVYAEGFKKWDGLELARIAKELKNLNKKVILYKAGRTPEGKDAAKGHTASAASNYRVVKSILSQAGVYVAETFQEFQDIIKLASLLEGTILKKSVKVPSLGALSNAGFEKCAIGDNIYDEDKKKLFAISQYKRETRDKIKEAFARAHIDTFIDIGEILDLSPSANDDIYEAVIRAVIGDENVDCGVFSIVPETEMLQTLDGIMNEDIRSEKSIAQKLVKIRRESSKPFIVPIESGRLYDPLVMELEKNGIPSFRSVDTAVKMFGRYINFRIRNKFFS